MRRAYALLAVLLPAACGSSSSSPKADAAVPDAKLAADAATAPDAMVALGAPETTITSKPGALVKTAKVTFAFSSDQAGATFECRVQPADFAACTSPLDVTVADGDHVFEVRAKNGSAVDATPAQASWSSDTAAPTVTITGGPSGDILEQQAAFTFTGGEPGVTFECKLSGRGDFASCTSGQSYGSLGVGPFTFSVRATDAAGNTGAEATRAFSVAIDTTITKRPPATTRASDATFEFTSNIGGATFECALDGGDFAPCTSPKTYGAVDNGEHKFQVRATVADGTDQTPASVTWTVDATGLVAVITSGADSGFSQASVTFTYTAGLDVAHFECGLDDNALLACSPGGVTFHDLVDKSHHTFHVRALDPQNHAGPIASRDFVVDTVPPVITVASPVAGATTGATAPLTYTIEAGATLTTCTLDGAPVTDCTSGATLTLADGDHTLVITATDLAGNVGTVSVMFKTNNVPPVVQILSPADPARTGAVGDITYSITGATTVACKVDGKTVACSPAGPYHFKVGSGPHTFTITGTSSHGVSASDTLHFTADADAPVIKATFVPGANGAGTIQVKITDASTFTVMCNFEACGSSASFDVNVTELFPGPNFRIFSATDEWGNGGEDFQFVFDYAYDTGHLVLIGDDFEPVSTVRPGIDGVADVLKSAAKLRHQQLPTRNVRFAIAAINGPSEPSIQPIANLLGAFPANFEIFIMTSSDQVLNGTFSQDVLIIPSFGGEQDLDSLYALWHTNLEKYLEDGGTVVVLDGAGAHNFRLLKGLLDVSASDTPTTECMDVPCNDADPLNAGELCDLRPSAVVFDTDEPWVTYSESDFGNDDAPFVLHKVFGNPNPGPAAIVGRDFATAAWFQDDEGKLLAHCPILSNGTAVHDIAPGATLSAAADILPIPTLISAVQVEPLDVLRFAPPNVSTTHPLSAHVTITLPGPVEGATAYTITVCNGSASADPSGTNMVTVTCGNALGQYDLLVTATDANNVLLAYILSQNTQTNTSSMEFNTWSAPNSTITIDAPGAAQINAEATLVADGESLFESQANVSGESLALKLGIQTGGSLDVTAWQATAVYDMSINGYTSFLYRERREAPQIGDRTVTLNAVPPLTSFAGDTDIETGRPMLTWGPASARPDGGFALLTFQRDGASDGQLWAILFPNGTSVVLPAIAEDDPSWPDNLGNVFPILLQLQDADYIQGYGDYLDGGFLGPRPKTYQLDSTNLVLMGPPPGATP